MIAAALPQSVSATLVWAILPVVLTAAIAYAISLRTARTASESEISRATANMTGEVRRMIDAVGEIREELRTRGEFIRQLEIGMATLTAKIGHLEKMLEKQA